MTLLSTLNTNAQSKFLGAAPYIPATFGENVSAAFGDMMFRSRINIAPTAVDITSITDRDNKIKNLTGVEDPFDLLDLTELNAKYTNPSASGKLAMVKEKQEMLDKYILQKREEDRENWGTIRTKPEIEEFTRQVARSARTELEDIQSRSTPTDRFLGGLVGGVPGAFTDPINLATLPLGVGFSRGVITGLNVTVGAGTRAAIASKAAKEIGKVGVAKAMGIEALINMGIEAAEIPAIHKWQNEIGHKYGVGEAVIDIGTAGAGGAAFTGIIRGAAAGMRAVGSKSMRYLEKLSEAPNINSDARSAFNYMSRVAHIDESIPVQRSINAQDITVNRAALQESQDAINNYREPDLSAANQRFELEDINFRATGELSEANVARVERRATGPAIITEEARFPNRKGADDFIRYKARELDEDRTAYMTQRDGDETVVLKINDETRIPTDEDGRALTFKSHEEAKAEAERITKDTDEDAYPISFNPKEKKADQVHTVVSGKGLRPETVTKMKENQEYLNVFQQPKGAEVQTGPFRPDFANMKLAEPTYMYDQFRMKNAAGDMQAVSEIIQDQKVYEVMEADFARLVKDNPELEVRFGEETLTIKDVEARFKEQDDIIEALTTCAIG
jgi:hypothetical protein